VSDALIGLDVGPTGVKAIAVSETGEVLARGERGSAMQRLHHPLARVNLIQL